jgi:hypothetical protein
MRARRPFAKLVVEAEAKQIPRFARDDSGEQLVPVRRLLGRERARELDEHRTQMTAIPQQIRGAAPAGEQKSDRREISFGRITELACEYEIVAPIVCRLPASRCHMVERHRCFGEPLTAVRADGTMLLEEPSPSLGVSYASRRM